MSEIVTLTVNPAVDTSTRVDRVTPGKKLRCDEPRREPGGGGLNVARAIRRMGGEALAFFLAGGPTGDILEELLSQEGVEARRFPVEEWTRENVMVRERDEDKSQYRFDMPGAELTREEWKACLKELEDLDPAPDYMVASGSLPPGAPDDFYGRVAEVADSLDARFILDTSGEALRRGLESEDGGTFLVKPNLRELAALTDVSTEELEDPSGYEAAKAEAAQDVVARGLSQVVVVSMGSAGALLVTERGVEKLITPTVPIKSRVGAGDSMVAGMVLGLNRGMSLRDAGLYGVAAGAAAVMTPGTELCRKKDVDCLFEEMKGE